MNKDEFYCELYKSGYESNNKGNMVIDQTDIDRLLILFFKDNVVIPKGIDRHPYADVLHEWVESAEMQEKSSYDWQDIVAVGLMFTWATVRKGNEDCKKSV